MRRRDMAEHSGQQGCHGSVGAGSSNPSIALQTLSLIVFAGTRPLLRNVSLNIPSCQVFGVIGPSGAGKSTLLRCLNRLIDLDPGLRVEGDILLKGRSIFEPGTDVDAL